MSVMLANRFVHARRFADALPFFEEQLRKHPDDYASEMKLILCYAQTSRIQESLVSMLTLLETAPECVFEENRPGERVAARYVIAAVERRSRVQPPDLHHTALAVLYLYVDPRRALNELALARESGADGTDLDRLQSLVRLHLETST